MSQGYCTYQFPLPVVRKARGVVKNVTVEFNFNTQSFTSFNWMYEAFYSNGRKVMPEAELLFTYLTPLAQAVLYQCSGVLSGNSYRINLASFNLNEVILFSQVFEARYGIKTTYFLVRSSDTTPEGGYILSISPADTPKFARIVKPFMAPGMYYRLGLHG